MGQQNASYAAAVANPIDLREAVRQYRANEVAIRRLMRSHPTRNAGATVNAVSRRQRAAEKIQLALMLAGHQVLVGELVEESVTLFRISNNSAPRPELQTKLTATRRRIRDRVQAR